MTGRGTVSNQNAFRFTATTGAVYGQLAGAYYGYSSIPESWSAKLRHHDMISDYAIELMNGTCPRHNKSSSVPMILRIQLQSFRLSQLSLIRVEGKKFSSTAFKRIRHM
jgi:hypothetical protein